MADSAKGLWFLLGLSVGAMVGILYAPRPGEETREMLKTKADEGRDLVQRKAGDLRQQVGTIREQAGTLRDQVGTIRDQVGNAREQAVDIADRGRQAITRQIDQFQAAVEAGKQAFRESSGEKKADDSDAASRL